MDDAQLQTIWQQRQIQPRTCLIGQPLTLFMRHTLAKKVRQISKLAAIWDAMIPEAIREHTALESFNRGTLTVLVDSAAHRFQLQMLLGGGLKTEIQRRFNGPINQIRLLPGRFCAIDVAGEPRYEF